MRDARLMLEIDGEVIDLQEQFNMFLADSPDIICAPLKPFETEQYPESNGQYIYPYTTKDGFDYKVTILYFGEEGSANSEITRLNGKLYTEADGVLKAKEVKLTNKYKNVSIVGYIKSLVGNDTDFDSDSDAWFFDLTIQVSDPDKCNFNTTI